MKRMYWDVSGDQKRNKWYRALMVKNEGDIEDSIEHKIRVKGI